MGADVAATPALDAADMAVVMQLGTRRHVWEGEYLYREGDVTCDFFVLVSAEVDIVVAVDGGERVIVRHGPGRFLGELNMLSGLRVFVSARAATAGEVVVVPRDRLRQLMATKPRLGDTILAAFVARRGLLMTGAAPAIRVIGSRFSPESLRIMEFLIRTRVPHEWLDADRDPRSMLCWITSASPPQSYLWSSPLAPCCAVPPPAIWPAISVSRSRACPTAASTWSWSGAAQPAWPRPSMEPISLSDHAWSRCHDWCRYSPPL
jgi:CRP-like cAMP-binding protein